MKSLARQSLTELGGAQSVLARQKRDHVELDGLIHAVERATGRDREKYLNDLCRLVFTHAFAEESVLWPVIRRWLPQGAQLTLEIERGHQEINELFARVVTLDVDGPEFEQLWPRIACLLREDVRDEEDRLLPLLQHHVTARTLARLGWGWEAVRRTAPTRPHPLVARRPPGNALAAVPLTLIDRSRDRLDRMSRRRSGPATLAGYALSAALGRLAGQIEGGWPFTQGEDPSTRSAKS